jgi:hypothetical protein
VVAPSSTDAFAERPNNLLLKQLTLITLLPFHV